MSPSKRTTNHAALLWNWCAAQLLLMVLVSCFPFVTDAQEMIIPESALTASDNSAASITETWHRVTSALDARDTSLAVDNLELLKKLRNEHGYEVLEPQSLELLRRAQIAINERRLDDAAFMVRKAIELSPTSSRVLLKSLPPLEATGVRTPGMNSLWSQFMQAVSLLGRNRDLSLKIVKVSLYPALWAITIGMFITFVFTFACNIHVLVARVAKWLPATMRGFVAVPIVLAMLVAPLLYGPVASILMWSVVSVLLMRTNKWLPVCAAAVLVLWGAMIPIREHLSERLTDPGIQALLRVSSGQYSPSDRVDLEEFSAKRQGDLAAQLLLGQILRREGRYEDAVRVFKNAQLSFGLTDGWLTAQLGVAQFLLGNSEEADSLFQQAQEAGMNSVEFWFNYSKVKFELTDTVKSREFFERALTKNKELTEELKSREDAVGLHNRFSFAEMHIPLRHLVPSIIAAGSDRVREYDARVAHIVPGTNPLSLMGIGFTLMCIAFWRARGQSRVRRLAFFSRYTPWKPLLRLVQLCPGGAWVLSDRPATCVILVSVLAFFALPFANWPSDSAVFLSYLPGIQPIYAAAVMLLGLGICYVGYFLSGEEE